MESYKRVVSVRFFNVNVIRDDSKDEIGIYLGEDPQNATEMRDALRDCFVSPNGRVSWQ